MRIDPAHKIEAEIADLQDQIIELRKKCKNYFKIIETLRSRRDGWKQNRMTERYGDKF